MAHKNVSGSSLHLGGLTLFIFAYALGSGFKIMLRCLVAGCVAALSVSLEACVAISTDVVICVDS
jgi:hypothetical protein